MRRFPNEMTVLYEDDEIVCYRLHQPPADWTDLYIEYGYNEVTARLLVNELKHGTDNPFSYGNDGQLHSYPFFNITNSSLGVFVFEGDKRLEEDSIEEGTVNIPDQSSVAEKRGGK